MKKKKSHAWPNCSEPELAKHITTWLEETDLTNALVFLEGEMGAGKSTFVREILRVLSPASASQGSPSFPIVQTYETSRGIPFYHIDLYRIEDEAELQDSGIEAQIEAEGSVVCIEWASLFADAFAHWFSQPESMRRKPVYLVSIQNVNSEMRSYQIDTF